MNVPYVVGPWVRGERFYGRSDLLEEALEGSRDRLWLVGTRRVGKTSLLREIERRAGDDSGTFVPVVWDLQGSDTPDELDLGLHEALTDVEPALAAADVELPAPGPAARTLAGLAAALRARGRRLLLLCDEAEDLFGLLRRHPELRDPLERAWTTAGARVVVASSVRLAGTAESGPERGLLAAFGPPAWVGPLGDGDARLLLRQENLPAGRRPALADAAVDLLATRCGGHPFLLQLAAKRAVELGDAEEACERLARDPTVTHLCNVDLGLLGEVDRELLAGLADPSASGPIGAPARIALLRALGLVRDGADGYPEPGSWFLGRHLAATARPRS
jgi:hypothetical protein